MSVEVGAAMKQPYQNRKNLAAVPSILVGVLWIAYIVWSDRWDVFKSAGAMPLVMLFGSFIAGASAQGGGAIAFPAMTLLFSLPPDVARNFSFAIQSVGMTSAAVVILLHRIPIEKYYLLICSLGGTIGIFYGTFYVAPHIDPQSTKLLFAAIWLSFGFVLIYLQSTSSENTLPQLPLLQISEKGQLFTVAYLGGIISSMFGSGLDICTFAYVILRYRLSVKIATPTSVVLMAFNAIVGLLIHGLVLQDFGDQGQAYWLACIPIVILGAPLGALYIASKSKGFITWLLFIIILIQFLGACFIVIPTMAQILVMLGVFVASSLVFCFLRSVSRK